jgi:uncharacterized protein YndB with AHSA1/START domain
MTDDKRAIELEIEVTGTPEQVWEAIATGPGITSWYVPHTVEPKQGGAMTASFGEGPEMQVTGRVAAWEPPYRVKFDGGDPSEGLAFEWLVEAKSGGTCVVRLVNSGFGNGDEWDDQYDAMHEGWRLFMSNLREHLAHFAGQAADVILPMAVVSADPDQAWSELTSQLGLPDSPSVGDRVESQADGVPHLSGTVVELMGASDADTERKMLLVVDKPAPGTMFVAAENHGPMTALSIWNYLYGDDGKQANQTNAPIYQELLNGISAD